MASSIKSVSAMQFDVVIVGAGPWGHCGVFAQSAPADRTY
jgi:hypothetical protein